MSTNNKQTEEEVDLGSLFLIIGKGFSNFFRFIGNIFKGIFHIIILFLIFLKKHFIKFAIAGILGGVIGGFFHYQKVDTYSSQMVLEPNFKSSKQLYFGISYFNNLIEQKEYDKLAKVFSISNKEAESLKNITIEPIVNSNDILNSFDEMIRRVDTTAALSYTFKDFTNTFTDYDYKYHSIEVISSQKDIFLKLKSVILSILEKNSHYSKVASLNQENFKRTDSIYRKDLVLIDSLNKVYMKVLLEEAKKGSTGTNIDLGNRNQTNKELELYETKRNINRQLESNVQKIAEKSDIVNIVVDFQPVGKKVSGLNKNLAVLGFVLFIGLVLLYLTLVELNRFLDNYKK